MSAANSFAARMVRYSVPLLVGVVAGLIAANVDADAYHALVHTPLAGLTFLGTDVSAHFLINDIFMVLFFGLAAKEIAVAVLPGGALNPPLRAVSPLLGTLGGVAGPALVFVLLTAQMFAGTPEYAAVINGWGIPTATDIALAWLAARLVFGDRHPAVGFLLLLAVVDDALGLAFIAIFYPDPAHPVEPMYLLLVAAGIVLALLLRKLTPRVWWPTVLCAGGLAWFGLFRAHLHPALALVFVVPCLPRAAAGGPSPLDDFEHALAAFVAWGLFCFAFANAGVAFEHAGPVTTIVTVSLFAGKALGITLLAWLGTRIGFPLPQGMDLRALFTVAVISAIGLTVALFMAAQAYSDPVLRAEAKLGALISAAAFPLAIVLGRLLKIRRITN